MNILEQIKFQSKFLLPYIAILVSIWVAHFLYMSDFGFYEDDYFFIGIPMGFDFKDLCEDLYSKFRTFHTGRPFHYLIPSIIVFIANKFSGLTAVYFLGFLTIFLNSFLLYKLLKKNFPIELALFSVLAFSLFPADTTKAFLTHSLSLYPSFTFMLIATHLYLDGRNVISYICIVGSLLTYETPALLFFAVPLLKSKWNKELFISFLKHIVVLIFIIIIYAVIRYLLGESRVLTLNTSMVYMPFVSALVGPITSLSSFIFGPLKTIHVIAQDNISITITVLILFILFSIFISFSFKKQILKTLRLKINCNPLLLKNSKTVNISWQSLSIFRAICVGLIMLPISYLLPFFVKFPPVILAGRGSRVHMAAALGCSLIVGALFYASIFKIHKKIFKCITVSIISLYFALLVGYGMVVQEGFKKSWENQQKFWTDIIKNCPDLSDGVIIFVLKEGLPKSKYIRENSSADYIILGLLYKFPKIWQSPPMLFVVSDLSNGIFIEKGKIMWNVPIGAGFADSIELKNNKVILLEMKENVLVRNIDHISVNGTELSLRKINASNKTSLIKGPLYKYLVVRADSNEENL